MTDARIIERTTALTDVMSKEQQQSLSNQILKIRSEMFERGVRMLKKSLSH